MYMNVGTPISIVVAQGRSVAMDMLTASTALVTGRNGGISRRNGLKLALAALAISSPSAPCTATTIRNKNMIMKEVEIERISLTSSKPFDAVVASIKAAVGQPDMARFRQTTTAARSFAELERAVREGLGRTGLMLFMEFDLGAILRRESGLETPKIVRFVIGNPLIMKEMVKHVHDAGSYAPVTILVDERRDGVHLSYDKMESLLAPYGSPDALSVARELDTKIVSLLREAVS
jgi:uncharacterized protein (DUF302 family)